MDWVTILSTEFLPYVCLYVLQNLYERSYVCSYVLPNLHVHSYVSSSVLPNSYVRLYVLPNLYGRLYMLLFLFFFSPTILKTDRIEWWCRTTLSCIIGPYHQG